MSGDSEVKIQDAGTCGPGCVCGASGSNGRGRRAVGIVILVVAGVLVVRAMVNGKVSQEANTANAGFATLPDPATASETTPETQSETSADTLKELGSLSDLNAVAGDTFGVFVFLPGRGETAAKAPMTQFRSAARTIEPQLRGGKIGMFALKVGSSDYEQLALQMEVPGVVAMVKGGGMSAASGDITETKLVQALVAASSAGGCGPSGCGPVGCN